MTLRKCYAVIGLAYGADLDEVKSAYRKLAFSLHPDLNPNTPNASRKFQELNEAYVILSQELSSGKTARRMKKERAAAEEAAATGKARDGAHHAYKKAQQGQAASDASGTEATEDETEHRGMDQQDVLKDILNDPFARRVFEDIYSHIRPGGTTGGTQGKISGAGTGPGPAQSATQSAQKPASRKTAAQKTAPAGESSVFGGIKGWLRKQIDDEQELRLPKEQIVPGARVRLQIQHGLGGEAQTVELTLPPNFKPEKAMRLKGMGRRLGNWRGDLYVRIIPS